MRPQELAARERLKHSLKLLEDSLIAIRSHVDADIPTAGVRQNLVTAATAVSEQLAVVDAFRYDREQGER